MDVITLLLLAGIIFIVGLIGGGIYRRTGIPDILILIGIGMLIGPVFGMAEPESMMAVAPYIAPIALMIILFDSGLAMNISKMIYESPRAVLLSVANFVLSILLVSIAMNMVFSWDYIYGALLGAIVGGTSSVMVIGLLKGTTSSQRASNLLILESAITDVLVVVTSIAMIDLLIANVQFSVLDISRVLLGNFSIGIVFGIVWSVIWLYIATKFRTNSSTPMFALASVFILYPISTVFGGSGEIATLVFGIILGNSNRLLCLAKVKYEHMNLAETRIFHTEISFFVRTFFFVYLGTIVSMQDTLLILVGFLLGLMLVFARRFGVLLSTIGSKLAPERQLIGAIAARGLAAAVVAQLPLAYGLPFGREYVDLTLAVIIATTIFSSVMVWLWCRYHPKEPAVLEPAVKKRAGKAKK